VGFFIAALLVAYNSLGPWRSGLEYVIANIAVAVLAAGLARWSLGLSPKDIGVSGQQWRVVLGAFVAAVAVTVPLYLLAAFESTARFVADERVATFSSPVIAFHMLVRIPLGTALAEELAFRGVLYGIFRRSGLAMATVGSSVAFGLWHVRPALASIRANFPDAGEWKTALLVLSAVVITAVAGALFCWLREKAGGIAAPWVLHATLNSLALGAAALAHNQ
jgi:membrane protease YdiL (CAAX protease family)